MPLTRLNQSQLEAEVEARPGLIPVALTSPGNDVVWLDLGAFHCSHGYFHESLSVFREQAGDERQWFLSPFEALLSPRIAAGCIPPSGFIFHAPRTGSTLLARSLSCSRRNVVFSEANVHNQIWAALSAAGNLGPGFYRALFVAMGRRRLHSYDAHIVKFSSWNIAGYTLIRDAFPGVPALFLYREPGEILESLRGEPPAWLGHDPGIGVVLRTPEEALEVFFRRALAIDESTFRCLDYRNLTPDSLPEILSFFKIGSSAEDLIAMRKEFVWDAKSGIHPKRFVAPLGDMSPAPGTLRQLYRQLGSHAPLLAA